jgi:hypothetical protein
LPDRDFHPARDAELCSALNEFAPTIFTALPGMRSRDASSRK